MNLKKKKKLYEECNSKTKPSFLLLSTSAVSRYSKQLRLPIHYQQENDAEAIRIWILEDFFVCFSLSVAIDIFFHPISKEQHSRLFYITYYSATDTSLNKRRKTVYVEKEIFSLYRQSPSTHTHTQSSIFRDLPFRQCCFWTKKMYRQLSESAWANKKTKTTTFSRCRCEQMVVIMKNEWM